MLRVSGSSYGEFDTLVEVSLSLREFIFLSEFLEVWKREF